MSLVWSKGTIKAFRRQRNAKRTTQGLDPFEELTDEAKWATLESEHDELRHLEETKMKMNAWAVEKYPPFPFWAPRSGVLQCPEVYGGTGGCSNLRFREGDDLNLMVHRHYGCIAADLEDFDAVNYVDQDCVRSARHEYIGPRPRVAGFRHHKGITEILFWDEHLEKAWVGGSFWREELYFDETVEAWFVDKMRMWE